jgi:hypothetical protein
MLKNERRPSGIVIENQQGMKVLGAYLSTYVSIRDHIVIGTSIEIECMPNHLASQISRSDRKAE